MHGGLTLVGPFLPFPQVVKVRSGDQLLVRGLSQLSGGERRRVAVALALGFAELLRCRGRLSSNLLILDEVSASLAGQHS